MHAALLAVVLLIPSECPQCQKGAGGGAYAARPAISALNCPHSTPPVRWYCKPCAGCAGGVCLSCQAPYYGSAPYKYRIAFDYPWSQAPAYPYGMESPPCDPGEEVPIETVPATSQKSRLRR
jgi:hypothetical protein